MTGHLNQPPLNLLNAINKLKATHGKEGRQIQETIQASFGRMKLKRGTRKELERPAASTDRLFRSNVLHAKKYDARGDKSTLVHRLPRNPRRQL